MSAVPDRSKIGSYLGASLGGQEGIVGVVVKVGFAVGRTKSKSCFHDRRPVPSERIGFVCVVPEVSPWPVFHTRLVCRAPLGHSKHPANPLA